jgi:hypothetical protein
MYMNISEVNTLLQNPLFTAPVTESIQDYEFYRGRRKVTIFTVRFNVVPTFNLLFMRADLDDKLSSHYPRGVTLSVAVTYDLLLRSNPRDDDDDISPPSYYIWRANTNQRSLDREDNDFDKTMYFTDHNVFTLCKNAARIDANELNIEFADSDVSIDRVLTIVLTFSSTT